VYKEEFDKLLKKSLVRSVLFQGENDFLVNRYKEYYSHTLNVADSMLSLYYDEYDFKRAKEYLSQSSLFGGANFLFIKTDKKIPKKEIDTLVSMCKEDNENYLIVATTLPYNRVKDISKSFLAFVRLFEIKYNDAISLLSQEAKKLNLDIDNYAISHLYTLLNNNISMAVKELEKLSILDRAITTKDIDMLVYSTAPLSIDSVIQSIFEKKPITNAIEKLLEMGEDEFTILRAIQRYITQLYAFHIYIKLHGRADAYEITGRNLPKFVSDKIASIAIRIRPQSYLAIFEELLKTELKMKDSKNFVYKDTLLFGVLAKIQSLII